MDSLARLLCWRLCCGGCPLLAFVHELGDEGFELGHLLFELFDATGVLGDALTVEGALLGSVIGRGSRCA